MNCHAHKSESALLSPSTLVILLIYVYMTWSYVTIQLLQEEYSVIICHHDAAKHKNFDTKADLFLIIKDR